MGHAEKKTGFFEVLKATDDKISKVLETSIKLGKWVLIEGVSEKLSAELEPVLSPQIIQKGKQRLIKFGDKDIEYHNDFKFFLTTTIPNPHYSPETCVKICLINFAITEGGLKDQMLSLVVSIEKADLEQERLNLVEQNAKNEKILTEKEDEILKDLKGSDPATILNGDALINKL
jgi:dynein heavy chain